MNAFFFTLLGQYGPIAVSMFPAIMPVLEEVTAAASGGPPIAVPAFRISWKGKHVEVGPIPIKLV